MSGSDKAGTTMGKARWAGRKATQRAFPIKPGTMCQRCHERPATQRHHIDGNENNTAPSNIKFVCQSCMTVLDKNRWGWKGNKK